MAPPTEKIAKKKKGTNYLLDETRNWLAVFIAPKCALCFQGLACLCPRLWGRTSHTAFQRSWLSRTHQGQHFPAKHFPAWLPSSRLLAKASFASFCQCLLWREVCHTHQSPCSQVKPNLLWTKPVEWKAASWSARIGSAPHLEQTPVPRSLWLHSFWQRQLRSEPVGFQDLQSKASHIAQCFLHMLPLIHLCKCCS